MANTENIEAKLCAYVDGELDAAGRAEIEAHLAANPQHKQLIEELRGQRDLLRDLPRVAAPGDLLETVQSQLERSALLDGGGGHGPADIAGRISPWPRILSVAAVLTMAVGLFAVIYYVVKQGNPNAASNRPQYATGVMPPPPATSPAGGESGLASVERDKDLSRMKVAEADAGDRARKLATDTAGEASTPATQPTFDVFASGGSAIDNKKGGEPVALTNIFAADTEQTQEKLKRSGNSVPSDSLVMVVASADPSQAQGEVQKYLDDNKIRWETVTEPVPQTNNKDTQSLAGSRLGNRRADFSSKEERQIAASKGGGAGAGTGGFNGKLGGGAAPTGSVNGKAAAGDGGAFANSAANDTKQQGEAVQQMQQIAQPQDDLALRKDASVAGTATANAAQQSPPQQQQRFALGPSAAPPPNPNTPNTASNAVAPPVIDLSPPPAPAAPATATPAPAATPALTVAPAGAPPASAAREQLHDATKQADGASALKPEAPGAQQPQRQIALDEQQPAPGQSAPAFIVARGLTRRQVSELNDSLATQNAGRVYNYRRSGDNFTPAPPLAPTTQPIATDAGQMNITAGSAAARAPATQSASGAIAATTQPASVVAPTVVSKSSATATTAPAQKPTAVAADSLGAIKKIDTLAATQPAAHATASPPPTTMASTLAISGMGSATTHPGDERLDVVICIQPPAPVVAPNAAPNAAVAAPNAAAPHAAVAAPNAAAAAPEPATTQSTTVAPNAAVAPALAPAPAQAETAEPSAPNDTPPTDSPADNAK